MAQKRNIGLDIVRVLATIMVLVCHSGFFSIGIDGSVVTYSGIISVEIFFVLSGFLVGRSMILAVTGESPVTAIRDFYINRFLRTLPFYYVMLFIIAAVKGTQVPLSCFAFLQNFDGGDLGFMPVSWTLPIEMWFYVLVPPVFLLLIKVFSARVSKEKAVFAAIGLLCALPFAMRVVYVLKYDPVWDFGVRKQIFLRLDSIMMGVILAAIKLYAREAYERIAQKPVWLLLSLAGVLALYLYYDAYLVQGSNFDDSLLAKIFVFTVVPLFACLFVMYMENCAWTERLRGKWIVKLLSQLSALSYGIYLIHWTVYETVSVYFVGARFSVSWLGFLGSTALTFVLAKVGYMLIEVPMIRLKNKILSKGITL